MVGPDSEPLDRGALGRGRNSVRANHPDSNCSVAPWCVVLRIGDIRLWVFSRLASLGHPGRFWPTDGEIFCGNPLVYDSDASSIP